MPHIPGHVEAAQQPVDEFELMRRRLRQRGAAAGEGQQRDLNRQFAALGNLPSGAAFKIRQQAQEAAERQTSQSLQDVNILQAQTQRAERESQAQRELQRFGIETGAATALEQSRIGARSASDVAGIQTRSAFDVAQLGARTDLELAELQGANQVELANIQIQSNERIQELAEAGMSQRLATQIGANRDLFDIELKLRERGLNMQETLQNFSIDQQTQQMGLDKAATVINALDPLIALGFDEKEIGSMVEALQLPFAAEIKQIQLDKAARLAGLPPEPSQPTDEEKFTEAIGRSPGDLVKAFSQILEGFGAPRGLSRIGAEGALGSVVLGPTGAIAPLASRAAGGIQNFARRVF